MNGFYMLAASDPVGKALSTGMALYNAVQDDQRLQLQKAADDRAERRSRIEEEGMTLANDKARALADVEDDERNLRAAFATEDFNSNQLPGINAQRQAQGQEPLAPQGYTDKMKTAVAKYVQVSPWLPNLDHDPVDFDMKSQAIGNLSSALPEIDTIRQAAQAQGLPADMPIPLNDQTIGPDAARAMRESLNVLAGKDRVQKQFIDHQTGEPYYTGGISSVVYDPGRDAFAVELNRYDKNFNLVGTVPATTGQGNGDDEEISFIPRAEIEQKLGIGRQLLATAQDAGIMDMAPEQRMALVKGALAGVDKDYFRNLLAESAKRDNHHRAAAQGMQLRQELEDSDILNDPEATPEEKRTEATRIIAGYDPDVVKSVETAALAAKAMEPNKKEAPATVVGGSSKGVGYEQRYAFNPDTGQYDTPVGSPMLKHPPAQSGDDKTLALTRRDISVRMRDAQRGYSAALKSNDPDKVAAAVDLISSLNEDAKTYGVPTLPVPKRPMTSDEEAQLRSQAVSNLKANRSAVGKLFDTSPTPAEIGAEVQRLRGGAAGQPSQQSQNDRPQPRPSADSFFTQQDAPSAMPPAAQHTGRTIRDTVTGRRYRSDGQSWQEVR